MYYETFIRLVLYSLLRRQDCVMVDVLNRYSFRRNVQHCNCNTQTVDSTSEDRENKIDLKVWKLGSAPYSNSWVYSL